MRWKAGVLLVGAAVLFTGLSSWVARRADTRDDRHHGLEVAASVAAVRVDSAVSRAATTLAFAGGGGDDADAARLSDTIGVPVCRRGPRPACARAGSPDLHAEPFRAAGVQRAEALAVSASVAFGRPGVAVVAANPAAPGTAIVVAVQHADTRLVALLPLEPGLVVPEAMAHRDGDTAGAPLTADFVNGRWSTIAVRENDIGSTVGLTWFTAVQVAAGVLTMTVAIVAMTDDQRRLRRRATIDSLTGLPNRAEFERRAARRLDDLGRDGRGACLIVVDLDGFKAINDSAGHAAGDRVLAEAGRRLAAAVRATDLVGRWGGDEFVLLLTGVSDPLAIPDRTAAIAACLGDLPTDPHTRLTASVGAAAFPLQGRDLATLLDLADQAMYDAKRQNGKLSPPDDAARSGADGASAVP